MLDLSKQYKTPMGTEVELFALRDGAYYGRYKDSYGRWQSTKYAEDCAATLSEMKPKHTKTYWLVHYENGASACCFVKPDVAIRPLQALAITGPHTITFEEGQDDRTK
jgi:hypothetical protein